MATDIQHAPEQHEAPASSEARPRERAKLRAQSHLESLMPWLKPLASLRLTVVLFALGIFIVFVGTLAQAFSDISQVTAEYFRINWGRMFPSQAPWIDVRQLFAWVELQTFFPPAFFPDLQGKIPGGFPFPKGWTIAIVMGINLLAAHTIRFKVQVKGTRLLSGLGIIAAGVTLTVLVILSGSSAEGLQGEPVLSWGAIWQVFKMLLAVGFLLSLAGLATMSGKRMLERIVLGVLSVSLLGSLGYILYLGWDFVPDAAGLRILWHLLKATAAGLVLLVGCYMVFKKRAGVVLLHAGVGLLMVSELLTGTFARESQLWAFEGEAVNFTRNLDRVELAVVDPSPEDYDQTTVIPQEILAREGKIEHDDLPFNIEVLDYMPNADFRIAEGEQQTSATAGFAKQFGLIAEPAKPITGMDSDKRNETSAYVRLTTKDGEPLGTYLLSIFFDRSRPISRGEDLTESITVGDKTYEVSLRHERAYKQYIVEPVDIGTDKYIGTTTPKDFYSKLLLHDLANDTDIEKKVWMNNPMRYSGETFYQSNYFPAGMFGPNKPEMTGLQIVTNSGWMMPYVACMIVATGMLAHFLITLTRFLRRTSQTTEKSAGASAWSWQLAIVPVAVLLFVAMMLLQRSRPPSAEPDEYDFYAAGQIPIAYEGRVKPLDTFARNTLRAISDKESLVDDKGTEDTEDDERITAIQWLFDSIGQPDVAREYQVFRIENLELLESLGLERRKGFRYSLAELRDGFDQLITNPETGEPERRGPRVFAEIQEAQDTPAEDRNYYQGKLLEFGARLAIYQNRIEKAFMPPEFPELTDAEKQAIGKAFFGRELDLNALDEGERAALMSARQKLIAMNSMIEQMPERHEAEGLPLIVPIENEEHPWTTFAASFAKARGSQLLGGEPYPAGTSVTRVISAYANEKPRDFNKAVEAYQEALAGDPPDLFSASKIRFESYFNHMKLFLYCKIFYMIAFLLALLGVLLLGFSTSATSTEEPQGAVSSGAVSQWLNRTSFWLIVATFLVHTVALILRMYISGRPPVTNLYSSAIFIGWGAVLFGIVLEAIYRMGLGNMVAAAIGFGTLLVAHGLAAEGDTIKVLQAVLDTQFWLATHVTCITLGYTTTFLAGALGLLYVALANRYGLLGVGGILAALGAFLIVGMDSSTALWSGVGAVGGGALLAVLGVLSLVGSTTPANVGQMQQALGRMIYGVVCFAILFSFVGTVLGGLWADDSWGRFWGWDPKENGALIIVMWNALVLHARWGGMVRNRGLAALAIVGNIVTAWSWFGTNELGVGLHAYGFTDGVLRNLGLFVATQLALIAICCLPASAWFGSKREVPAGADV